MNFKTVSLEVKIKWDIVALCVVSGFNFSNSMFHHRLNQWRIVFFYSLYFTTLVIALFLSGSECERDIKWTSGNRLSHLLACPIKKAGFVVTSWGLFYFAPVMAVFEYFWSYIKIKWQSIISLPQSSNHTTDFELSEFWPVICYFQPAYAFCNNILNNVYKYRLFKRL